MPGVIKEWNAVSIDMGCEYSASCLECPLPVCQYEIALSTQLRIYRDAIIVKEIRQNTSEQHTKIAVRLGISLSIVKQAWQDRRKVDSEVKRSIVDSEWIQRLINGSS